MNLFGLSFYRHEPVFATLVLVIFAKHENRNGFEAFFHGKDHPNMPARTLEEFSPLATTFGKIFSRTRGPVCPRDRRLRTSNYHRYLQEVQ